MTHKEAQEQLWILSQSPLIKASDRITLDRIACDMELPKPKPGKAIHCKPQITGRWEMGITAMDGVWLAGSRFMKWREIEWKPAHVLGPDDPAPNVLQDRIDRAVEYIRIVRIDYPDELAKYRGDLTWIERILTGEAEHGE